MITLMIFTHGRDRLLQKTIDSFNRNVTGPITRVIVNDDSIVRHNHLCDIVHIRNKNVASCSFLKSGGIGFAGAIANAWEYFYLYPETPYIFHLEDDFIFNREIDLWQMMGIMDSQPQLAQLALMRQPWNEQEKEAGSLYRLNFESFHNKRNYIHDAMDRWVEHDLWFTTNPCLYPRQLVKEFDWPQCDHSEGIFTHTLLERGFKFGYVGTKEDEPWVTHIGNDRFHGKGY